MKILICGAKGQLGSDCVRVLQPRHDVVAVDLEDLDITRPDAVETAVQTVRPEVLINCAGHTGVDACETQAELAQRINAMGPKILAQSVDRIGGTIIHISTDYVFDGLKPVPEPYIESDAANPVSQYGISKRDGEKAVISGAHRHIIMRTAWMYGASGKNFLKTILAAALRQPGNPLRIVNDQYGSPTWSYRLALQIEKLIEDGGQGIYHASAEGYCTWYELASAFLEQMNIPHTIRPCTTAEYPTPALRPANSILENHRLKAAEINVMTHWKADLNQFITQHGDALLTEAAAKKNN